MRFDWSRGDVFVIPSWRKALWNVGEESFLLRVSDQNLLEKLHRLHTTEPGSAMQNAEQRRRASF